MKKLKIKTSGKVTIDIGEPAARALAESIQGITKDWGEYQKPKFEVVGTGFKLHLDKPICNEINKHVESSKECSFCKKPFTKSEDGDKLHSIIGQMTTLNKEDNNASFHAVCKDCFDLFADLIDGARKFGAKKFHIEFRKGKREVERVTECPCCGATADGNGWNSKDKKMYCGNNGKELRLKLKEGDFVKAKLVEGSSIMPGEENGVKGQIIHLHKELHETIRVKTSRGVVDVRREGLLIVKPPKKVLKLKKEDQ